MSSEKGMPADMGSFSNCHIPGGSDGNGVHDAAPKLKFAVWLGSRSYQIAWSTTTCIWHRSVSQSFVLLYCCKATNSVASQPLPGGGNDRHHLTVVGLETRVFGADDLTMCCGCIPKSFSSHSLPPGKDSPTLSIFSLLFYEASTTYSISPSCRRGVHFRFSVLSTLLFVLILSLLHYIY